MQEGERRGRALRVAAGAAAMQRATGAFMPAEEAGHLALQLLLLPEDLHALLAEGAQFSGANLLAMQRVRRRSSPAEAAARQLGGHPAAAAERVPDVAACHRLPCCLARRPSAAPACCATRSALVPPLCAQLRVAVLDRALAALAHLRDQGCLFKQPLAQHLMDYIASTEP